MKIKVTFKTPDAMEDALDRAFPVEISEKETVEDDTYEENRQAAMYEAEAQLNKFISYGECVIIEVDTETGTATVVPAK